MAYADQQMSGNRITALVIVALIHIALGYALVTGLAYEGLRQVVKKVTAVDIKKEEKKKEEPPPPKKIAAPPPIVAPPPRVNINAAPPPIQTVIFAPPPPPQIIFAPPAAAPAAPPPPRIQPKIATPKGNPANWATPNDYPSRALREEREGTTGFRVSVTADGRAGSCDVTSSSGSPDLDAAACSNILRRARFNPATDGDGNPTTGTYSNRVRWQIPKE